jgi:hypothetical protein
VKIVKRQFDVLTTANCRSVVKSLFVASWESIARDVIVWEHYGIFSAFTKTFCKKIEKTMIFKEYSLSLHYS